jgi:hypothetical protein
MSRYKLQYIESYGVNRDDNIDSYTEAQVERAYGELVADSIRVEGLIKTAHATKELIILEGFKANSSDMEIYNMLESMIGDIIAKIISFLKKVFGAIGDFFKKLLGFGKSKSSSVSSSASSSSSSASTVIDKAVVAPAEVESKLNSEAKNGMVEVVVAATNAPQSVKYLPAIIPPAEIGSRYERKMMSVKAAKDAIVNGTATSSAVIYLGDERKIEIERVNWAGAIDFSKFIGIDHVKNIYFDKDLSISAIGEKMKYIKMYITRMHKKEGPQVGIDQLDELKDLVNRLSTLKESDIEKLIVQGLNKMYIKDKKFDGDTLDKIYNSVFIGKKETISGNAIVAELKECRNFLNASINSTPSTGYDRLIKECEKKKDKMLELEKEEMTRVDNIKSLLASFNTKEGLDENLQKTIEWSINDVMPKYLAFINKTNLVVAKLAKLTLQTCTAGITIAKSNISKLDPSVGSKAVVATNQLDNIQVK